MRTTQIEVNGIKLTSRVKMDTEATSVSSLFLLHKYSDEEILAFLEQRPNLICLDYRTKDEIINGIRYGRIIATMIGDTMFLSRECDDGTEAMVLYLRTGSDKSLREWVVKDVRRFCMLLLKARTSK